MTFETAPGGDFESDPGLLDGVGIIDGEVGVIEGELADLGARFFGRVEAESKGFEEGLV